MRLKNPKAKGWRNEKKARLWLQDTLGCTHVIRAGGSLGLFDLIGFTASQAFFIQVKSNRRPGTEEWVGLVKWEAPAYGRKALLVFKDRVKKPEVEWL